MRRNAITSAVQEESDEINLTPMLDVVFIMLIFFIVTANFIKEPGLEINRPDSDTAETQENAAILIAVGPTGEVWMDGRRIDVRQVKANAVSLSYKYSFTRDFIRRYQDYRGLLWCFRRDGSF